MCDTLGLPYAYRWAPFVPNACAQFLQQTLNESTILSDWKDANGQGYRICAVANESLYTRLMLENDMFGISHDKVNFLEMKQKDLETCVIAKTIRCGLSAVARDVFHRLCLSALFQNDKHALQELCNYRLEPKTSNQTVYTSVQCYHGVLDTVS